MHNDPTGKKNVKNRSCISAKFAKIIQLNVSREITPIQTFQLDFILNGKNAAQIPFKADLNLNHTDWRQTTMSVEQDSD